jgi:undecaprenyl-diphosphatase
VVALNADDESRRPDLRRGAFVLAAGYVALFVVMLALGLTLTHLLTHSVGRWDESANRLLAARREGMLNRVTGDATFSVNTLPAIGTAAIITVLLWLLRCWRMAVMVVVALALELAVFLSVTWIVARPRPDVPRLNTSPSTGSFPSGHTAAATVLYIALAIGLSTRFRNTVVRVIVFVATGLFVMLVAFGRVYRGLHNPSDVVVGAILGACCLAVAALAVRAAYAERKSAVRTSDERCDFPARARAPAAIDDSTARVRFRSSV